MKFRYECETQFSKLIYETQGLETWMEVMEDFRVFLLGCGYVIPEIEITKKEDEE